MAAVSAAMANQPLIVGQPAERLRALVYENPERVQVLLAAAVRCRGLHQIRTAVEAMEIWAAGSGFGDGPGPDPAREAEVLRRQIAVEVAEGVDGHDLDVLRAQLERLENPAGITPSE